MAKISPKIVIVSCSKASNHIEIKKVKYCYVTSKLPFLVIKHKNNCLHYNVVGVFFFRNIFKQSL